MKENGNKQFWDRWAGFYERFMHSNERLYDEIAGRMKGSLNRNMYVLELACGTGLISRRIVGCVKSLEATDFSEKMIAEAKKNVHSVRAHFSVQDARSLSYASESFDAVVIANALHILPEPEKVLAEIDRVLKPGGLLLAPTFVHGEGFGFQVRTGLMKLVGFRVCHKWSTRGFAVFISEHGFAVTEQTAIGSNIAPLCYLAAKKTTF
ncbi:MAG: class I SAM-dependent methyltransferase [Candidatus Ventricola sp.]